MRWAIYKEIIFSENNFSGASIMGSALGGVSQSRSAGNGLSMSYIPFSMPLSMAQLNLLYVTYIYKKVMSISYGEGNYYWKKIKGAPGMIWNKANRKNFPAEVMKVKPPLARGDFIVFSKFIKSFNEIIKKGNKR